MDLGVKNESPSAVPQATEAPKVNYPGLSFRDKVAEEFQKTYDCKLGDEITATVKLKVTGHRADQYGKSVDFDVISADGFSKGEKPEEKTDEKEVLGYERPEAATSKENPPVDLD